MYLLVPQCWLLAKFWCALYPQLLGSDILLLFSDALSYPQSFPASSNSPLPDFRREASQLFYVAVQERGAFGKSSGLGTRTGFHIRIWDLLLNSDVSMDGLQKLLNPPFWHKGKENSTCLNKIMDMTELCKIFSNYSNASLLLSL